MELIVITILVSAAALLLVLSLKKAVQGGSDEIRVELPSSPAKKPKLPCILCGAPLTKGENLKSGEFKAKDHSIVHMYGCPYCYDDDAQRTRTCPVCARTMPRDGYLTGRMWITKKGKKHLHVSGCTLCAGRKNP